MTTVESVNSTSGRATSEAPAGTVLIAEISWPKYKLEALAAGLIMLLLAGLATGSASAAVWFAVAGTVAVWWTRRWYWDRASR